MSLFDQYTLSVQTPFIQHVQASIVHTSLNIVSEVANEVQSLAITGGTPVSGNVTPAVNAANGSVVPWNCTAAQMQTALQAAAGVGAGQVVCTGGPWPGTAIAVTFAGTMGASPQNLVTFGTSTLSVGVAAATRTTTGVAVANHAARQALASKVLNNPTGYAALFAIGVADGAAVQADYPGPAYTLTATEAQVTTDINNQVSAIFNAFA
jgi:hypothetical protein